MNSNITAKILYKNRTEINSCLLTVSFVCQYLIGIGIQNYEIQELILWFDKNALKRLFREMSFRETKEKSLNDFILRAVVSAN